jgi:hypothetical protein
MPLLHPRKRVDFKVSRKKAPFAYRIQHVFSSSIRRSVPIVTMAVKKSKKDANSINSKLALVMKSGKVTLGYKSSE